MYANVAKSGLVLLYKNLLSHTRRSYNLVFKTRLENDVIVSPLSVQICKFILSDFQTYKTQSVPSGHSYFLWDIPYCNVDGPVP